VGQLFLVLAPVAENLGDKAVALVEAASTFIRLEAVKLHDGHVRRRLAEKPCADAAPGPARFHVKLLHLFALGGDEADDLLAGRSHRDALMGKYMTADEGAVFLRRMQQRHPVENV